MERVSKPPEERRRELIDAALKLFCEKGYEQTSVRDILEAVGGKVGMFYHHFKSKDEIFTLALEQYMDNFAGDLSELADFDTAAPADSVQELIRLVGNRLLTYRDVWAGKLHWSVAGAIYKKTLERMLPSVERMVARILEKDGAGTELQKVHDISLFLLHGISGILHEKPWADLPAALLQEKLDFIASLVLRLFPGAGGEAVHFNREK